MSVTDELRAELTKRGVEWKAPSSYDGSNRYDTVAGGYWFHEFDGKITIHGLTPAQAIAATLGPQITGDTSDGYHTFNELYHHRAVLFSVIVRDHPELAWKSKLHHDGTMYDGMFIVGIETPQGQATYHYDIEPYWEMFDCKELERAPEWDGHTPDQAIERIATLGRRKCKNVHEPPKDTTFWPVPHFKCSVCGKTHVSMDYVYFCPNCGAEVIDE